VNVEDDSEVAPGAGADVAEASKPQCIATIGSETAVHEIMRRNYLGAGDPSVSCLSLANVFNAMLPHQPATLARISARAVRSASVKRILSPELARIMIRYTAPSHCTLNGNAMSSFYITRHEK